MADNIINKGGNLNKKQPQSDGPKQPTPDQFKERKFVFKLLPGEERRFKSLPATNLIWDENRQMPRHIRLVEGVDTFFKDEQDARKIDNNLADNRAWRPEFAENFLILTHPRDKQKIEYLMLLDGFVDKKVRYNSSRPPLFELLNKADKHEKDLEHMRLRRQAVDKAFERIESGENFMAHARYLGISDKDGYGNSKEPEAIQAEYVKAAESNPDAFIKSVSSPIVKLRHMISELIDNGGIDLGYMAGQAHWADTKALITVIAPGKDAITSLAEFAMTADGAEFAEFVKDKSEK